MEGGINTMKKVTFVAIILVLTLMLSMSFLPGCKTTTTAETTAAATTAAETTAAATTAAETTAAATEAGKVIKVGFTILCTDGFYIKKYIERYNQQIADNGYESVMLDCTFDVAKQVSQIDNLIAQGVDIIFVMPADPKAVIPGIQKAKEAGIPVLAVHDKIDPSGEQYTIGYAGADSVKLGEGAGILMEQALNGNGNIVVLGGSYGANYGIALYSGFKSKISAGIKILGEGDHGWDRAKSMALMEDFLTKYDNIDGVYAFDDNTGFGAIDAIKAAQRTTIKVVSINGQKEAFDAIKAGDLFGTVKQDPVANVDKAFESLALFLAGKDVPQYNYSDSPIVTKENVDSLEPSF